MQYCKNKLILVQKNLKESLLCLRNQNCYSESMYSKAVKETFCDF